MDKNVWAILLEVFILTNFIFTVPTLNFWTVVFNDYNFD